MATPILNAVQPAQGRSGGGELVRLVGTSFASRVSVLFDGVPAVVVTLREEAGRSIADVRTPAHDPGSVLLVVQNLNPSGVPIAGETAVLPNGYRFGRPELTRESDLTRLVRTLLREIKRQVLANTSITVSVDYDDTVVDGLDVVAIAKVPSVVLSAPRISENRFYSTNELREVVVMGPTGPEIQRLRPPFTADLMFSLTLTTDRTVELLNLVAAITRFLDQNRWVTMFRDADDPSLGTARWEMDPDGDAHPRLDGTGDVRVYGWGFVVRGFDFDGNVAIDRSRLVAEPSLGTQPIPRKGA